MEILLFFAVWIVVAYFMAGSFLTMLNEQYMGIFKPTKALKFGYFLVSMPWLCISYLTNVLKNYVFVEEINHDQNQN